MNPFAWLLLPLLLLSPPDSGPAALQPGEYTLRSGRTVLHSGPGFGTETVGILEGVGPWRVAEQKGGWVRIDGRGWIPLELVVNPPAGGPGGPREEAAAQVEVGQLKTWAVPKEPDWTRARAVADLLEEERRRADQDARRRVREATEAARIASVEELRSTVQRMNTEWSARLERERADVEASTRAEMERQLEDLGKQVALRVEEARIARADATRASNELTEVRAAEREERALPGSQEPPGASAQAVLLAEARREGYDEGLQAGRSEGQKAAASQAEVRKETYEEGRIAGEREGRLAEQESWSQRLREAETAARSRGYEEGRRSGEESTRGERENLDSIRGQAYEEGRRAGVEVGRKAGLVDGRAEGIEEGRREGIEEGRRAGIEEGRQAALSSLATAPEGTATEETRRSTYQRGLEDGRSTGFEEGKKFGYEQGRHQALTAARAAGEREMEDRIRGARQQWERESREELLRSEKGLAALQASHAELERENESLKTRLARMETSGERRSSGRGRRSRAEDTRSVATEAPESGEMVPAEELERVRAEARMDKVRALQQFYEEIEDTFTRRMEDVRAEDRARYDDVFEKIVRWMSESRRREEARALWEGARSPEEKPKGTRRTRGR